eukprot:GILJ01001850.1.p1 GENE.GILJ01001850.1~~GILJ01001850.1.p1  ORF type:complete len:349 (-),score=63.76 GILJ01001850.1:198-1214(-)
MKAVVLVSFLFVAVAVASLPQEDDLQELLFQRWIQKHNKMYETRDEYLARFANFKRSVARVNLKNVQHQTLGGDAVFGLTKFSDLSQEEFRRTKLGFKRAAERSSVPVMEALPAATSSSIDWRKKGAVTPVKDQQQCGSCWAFSATEQIESNWALAGNSLVELSPQQIVSCDTTDGGCNGGDTITAFEYVEKAGGLDTDKVYPYKSGSGDSGTCKFVKSGVVAKITGYKYVTQSKDEKQMEAALEQSPLSVCVEADTWQDYSSGIIKSNCGTDLDHCVQVVGMNTESKVDYWIVRNSWNTDWGQDGYIYIQRGKDLCGIADEVTIVTAKKASEAFLSI